MVTLSEACVELGIGEKTLRKWMKRLGIKPLRHPHDHRFYCIAHESVTRIAQTRAQMPKMGLMPK